MRVVEIAEKEIGYKEKPINDTKYGAWFGLPNVFWCGIFVSWVYDKAGKNLGRIGYLKGFAGCQTAVKYFREKGKITSEPKAGDIVFFDWNKDNRHDHTGIFVKWIDDNTFETIEGNTSLKNQSNGGSVMRRVRNKNTALFVSP